MKYVHVIPRFLQFGVCFQCPDMNTTNETPSGSLAIAPGFSPPPIAPPLISCSLCDMQFDPSQTRKTTIDYHKQACYTMRFRNAVTKFNQICWKCGKVCSKNNMRVSCFLILIIFAFLHTRKSTVYCMLTEVSPSKH